MIDFVFSHSSQVIFFLNIWFWCITWFRVRERERERVTGYLRDSFLLSILRLRSSSIQHLEKIRCLGTHSGVDVHFTALNVVVQIVSKHVYQVDGIVASFPVSVTWKQH